MSLSLLGCDSQVRTFLEGCLSAIPLRWHNVTAAQVPGSTAGHEDRRSRTSGQELDCHLPWHADPRCLVTPC